MGKAKLGPATAKWKIASTAVPVPDRANRRRAGAVAEARWKQGLCSTKETEVHDRWVFARMLSAREEHTMTNKKIDPLVNTIESSIHRFKSGDAPRAIGQFRRPSSDLPGASGTSPTICASSSSRWTFFLMSRQRNRRTRRAGDYGLRPRFSASARLRSLAAACELPCCS